MQKKDSASRKSKTKSSRNCTATRRKRSGSLRMGKEAEKVRQGKFATQHSQQQSIQADAKTEKQVAQEDVKPERWRQDLKANDGR